VALIGTRLELVLHHAYTEGHARDRSGAGNHGGVVDGDFAAGHGLVFNGRDSRVVVAPMSAFRSMRALRVTVHGRVDELTERSNLVEGYLSFALIVLGDGSLQGGVYTRSQWLTVRSAPEVIAPGRWFTASFVSSAVHGGLLYLDGQPLAGSRRRPARIGDVRWPFGVNIGAWPDRNAFVLRGALRHVRLWVAGANHGVSGWISAA
jgi:hypothetical protein